MKAFDLEKALSGEKVIDIHGDEVEQLTHYNIKIKDNQCLFGVRNGSVEKYTLNGTHYKGWDLFMASKKLSGFVNVYESLSHSGKFSQTHSKMADECLNKKIGSKRVACIDLSQFEEGHGL